MQKRYLSNLIDVIAYHTGEDRKVVKKICNTLFEIIKREVENGNSVNIKSFGTFIPTNKGETNMYIPKLNKKITIPNRRGIKLRIARTWYNKINS